MQDPRFASGQSLIEDHGVRTCRIAGLENEGFKDAIVDRARMELARNNPNVRL
ncbi:MAG: hypothetical protein WC985_01955 [Thermoplasmata archaeon]